MYNPLDLTKRIEKLVTKIVDGKLYRKYYRFRPARFYDGIASADCVGCNLRCVYCWSNDSAREGKIGKFYSPEEVATKLMKIAERFGYKQLRITGNEPTISAQHLLDVLKNLPSDFTFILETNGILLGNDKRYVKELRDFNLHVRVSLKGCTEQEFSKLTGAAPKAFRLQLDALKFCLDYGIACHPAILIDLVNRSDLRFLKKRLEKIDKALVKSLEFETLIKYPHVLKRLKNLTNFYLNR